MSAEEKDTCACDAPINLIARVGGGQLKELQIKIIGRTYRVGCLKKEFELIFSVVLTFEQVLFFLGHYFQIHE